MARTDSSSCAPQPNFQPAPPSAAVPAVPKAIVLVKPPMLGPMGPNIVLLPARIGEPEIRVKLTAEQDRPPAIARNVYRGRIDIVHLADGKYVALNAVPLETYLQGVLARELLGSWNPAAFRAQAIAARTFALFEMLLFGERTFGVRLPPSHLTRNNLASVATMAQCMAELAGSGSSSA